jgi:hypothetical protein
MKPEDAHLRSKHVVPRCYNTSVCMVLCSHTRKHTAYCLARIYVEPNIRDKLQKMTSGKYVTGMHTGVHVSIFHVYPSSP